MYPLAIPLSSFDVEITSPANGTTVYTSNVLVTGTAAPGYWLDVNGFLVNVKDDGTFSIVLSLPEGENTIEARSTALFLEASGSVTITYVDQPQQDLEDARSRLAEVTAQLESARAWIRNLEHDLRLAWNEGNATQDDLGLTEKELGDVKNDPLPLVLGTAGLIAGLAAIALVFVQSRKPKAP
nr:DUF4859 domain-containing protein [Methanomassiliicoccus luminyensis]